MSKMDLISGNFHRASRKSTQIVPIHPLFVRKKWKKYNDLSKSSMAVKRTPKIEANR